MVRPSELKKMSNKIIFKPIGIIRSSFKKPEDTLFCCEKGLKANTISQIIIQSQYKKGLKGLDKFSHIFVLYHLDKIKKSELLTYPGPTTIDKLPIVGIFASRSQYRPNPIALRLVQIVKVKNNKILVNGLDALDGSPVIDLKPYVKGFDRPEIFRQAGWYDWLNKNL